MTTRLLSRFSCIGLALGTIFWLQPFATAGDPRDWDASGSNPTAPTAGAGTWSTSAANWSDGATNSGWNNAANHSAIFTGGLGSNATVNVTGAITVDSITFAATGSGSYTVSGGANIITLTSGLVTSHRTSTIQAILTGANGFTKEGAGTLVLFAANTYTGATVINSNILQARAVGALPTSTVVTIGNAATNGTASLDVRANQTVAGIAKGGTGNVTITNSQSASTVLTVNPDGAGGAAADSTFAGVIRDGDATHILGLTKAGSHTLTLTGVNTYTGLTTVSGGKLIVDGSLAAGSAVTVEAAGTLGGTGVVGGGVTILGTLAPGNSIETLDTGSLNIGSTGTLSIELGRSGGIATSDRVNASGEVTLNGANLELTLFSGLDAAQNGDIFWLVNNASGENVTGVFTELNGIATTLNEGSTFLWNSQEWEITYEASFDTLNFEGGNDIAIQAVPEPGGLILGALGLLLLGRRRRAGRVD